MRFAILGLALLVSPALAQDDPALAAYATAQKLVRVAPGRRINLVCMGHGTPAVILTAGQGDWSLQWSHVQPEAAKQTKVCAWDRAGAGFSDAGATPMDIEHNVTDLERALSGIRGPYVLVAHSAGAYETLIFADRHKRQVAGMVLVEPSIAYQDAVTDALGPQVAQLNHLVANMVVSKLRKCADDLKNGTLAPDSAAALACPNYPAGYPPALEGVSRHRDAAPARLALHADLDGQFTHSSEAVANPERNYGAMPLIVLTAGKQDAPAGLPPDVAALWPRLAEALNRGHDAYAALSSQGSNRLVAGAGHQIPAEKPEAVITAIGEVVDKVRQAAH